MKKNGSWKMKGMERELIKMSVLISPVEDKRKIKIAYVNKTVLSSYHEN